MSIVHMARNSAKYIASKDRKAVCRDLRAVYSAPNEDEALAALDEKGSNRRLNLFGIYCKICGAKIRFAP